MAVKKARQRISYVLENVRSSEAGHRLGVNGLAVDNDNDILYSGGRDGIVCAWDLNLDSTTSDDTKNSKSLTKLRTQTQAHMHWINDIALAQGNSALVTASSDLAVKVWRPHSQEDNKRAITIGEHADYVKCVAPPPRDVKADWIASGGLDRKICLWDLNGGGKALEIDVKGDEVMEKGSVYALTVGHNIMATGGPEKSVKLYDPRTGSQISKLVGHVDNIRSILIGGDGDTVLSASADKTIKLWSIKGGRCVYTFTMHDESVWSLYSNDPHLGVFYSSDRTGIVAKTDVRGSLEDMDYGLSLALAQEHTGVNTILASKGHIWTATSQSSINRWEDIDTGAGVELPEALQHHQAASVASGRPRQLSIPPVEKKRQITAPSILRLSNTAIFPSTAPIDGDASEDTPSRKGSVVVIEQPDHEVQPVNRLPEDTIEGQFGLLKHRLLNDRRRVLTLDTAGDVLLWDLIKCKPIQSFGKQHLEDVEAKVNTREAVAPWCSVDLSSGNITVVLEPYNCFDAEVYVDELDLDEPIDYREDQRIVIGKWILRYLFANLIDEEIKRDEAYRQNLNGGFAKNVVGRAGAPTSIALPQNVLSSWQQSDAPTPKAGGRSVTTPKAVGHPVTTPGLAIGLATPTAAPPLPSVPEGASSSQANALEKTKTNTSRPSTEQPDYFSSGIAVIDGKPAPTTPAAESAEAKEDNKEKEKDTKSPTSTFGKKFRIPFGVKKLGRSASQATSDKPAVGDEKAEESESSSNHDREVDDNFHGLIQKIHQEYDRQQADSPDKPVETLIQPSLPNETPVLKLPPGTKVIIQEETSGGNTNLYQGTVENMGKDADIIESKAPMWLGDILLQNQPPLKELTKVSFTLTPLDGLPPINIGDGNSRLNANRMLRVKKVLAYIAERIEAQPDEPEPEGALRPEEYLDLYCNDLKLSPTTTLTTIRTHLWKGGTDIPLTYKANGRKQLKLAPIPPRVEEPVAPEVQQGQATGAPPADAGNSNPPA